ncbi:MAG: MBL fold metallo-hydrolase [Bacteroidota bacterium]|nr:MBL fold metallo-hydrolase [Bacteroidota bacterium]
MEEKKFQIRFLGGAGTVTGSKNLLTYNDKNILVDCGLFQGLKELRLLNWEKLPVDPATVDLVILTHAHLDHVGYLPRLVQEGFKGKIFCSAPTRAIAEVILLDSARIQEEDADIANRMGYSKHKPAKPLYTVKDAQRAIHQFQTVNCDEWVQVDEDVRFRLNLIAHIMGATFAEIEAGETRLVFSGDIGRTDDPMLEAPNRPAHADYIIMESTYGDRHHRDENTTRHFRDIVNKTYQRGGTLIIPSFTVDRAQDFIWMLWQLKKKNEIPDLPVYLDSPMGVNVSKIYAEFDDYHNLGLDVFDEAWEQVKTVRSVKNTYQISKDKTPKIVIAGSGMMNGGRVLLYLQDHLPNPNSTVLIAGYQAEGTRGRLLQSGIRELKIHGHFYQVNCHLEEMHNMSSHADQDGLIDWLAGIRNKPKSVFIVHGEAQAANALRVKIRHIYHWDVAIPKLNETFPLY